MSLAPILDENGLLRLGGRCGKAKLPYEVLHPPIIPGSHPLASIIAKACHEKFTHAGTDFVLAQLRRVGDERSLSGKEDPSQLFAMYEGAHQARNPVDGRFTSLPSGL